MAIADSKKCQSMINVLGQQITTVRSAIDTMKAIRTLFLAVDPDTTGTPLDGNVALVNTALTALDEAVNTGTNNNVWNQMVASVVPSHRNTALEE